MDFFSWNTRRVGCIYRVHHNFFNTNDLFMTWVHQFWFPKCHDFIPDLFSIFEPMTVGFHNQIERKKNLNLFCLSMIRELLWFGIKSCWETTHFNKFQNIFCAKLSSEIRQSTIWYAGLLVCWDKWLVDQVSNFPSNIFMISCRILCKNIFNLFVYFF